MTTEERENRALARWLAFIVAVFLVAAGMLIGNTFPMRDDESAADWTVAPCAMWDDTSHPVLPRFTRDDVCAAQTATGAWYISSPTNPSPLAQ